ncbi:MAG: PAS domain S-box protein, partial [Gemmatimonadales bacterium]
VQDYAIFMLDPDGTIVSWNRGAERIKGYTEAEAVGRHFSIFYGEEDQNAARPRRALEIALREGRYQDEGWRYRKNGRR